MRCPVPGSAATKTSGSAMRPGPLSLPVSCPTAGPTTVTPLDRSVAMFALVAGGELYLKADGDMAEMFRKLGSRPFTFERRDGRLMAMSYWLMPESALDDPDEAAELAAMAWEPP